MISKQLESIRQRIRQAAVRCGRNPESVKLVAVTKTVPVERIQAAIRAGINIIGESYIQEAQQKFELLGAVPISPHFIGRLQTNKAKYAVKLFDLIQSVDNEKLAREINRQAAKISKKQDILIQVNIAEEAAKAGVALEHAMSLLSRLNELEHLTVKGLMTIPPYYDDPNAVRPFYAKLRQLSERLQDSAQSSHTIAFTELSMGMSHDFEAAIEEGATMVRIGTAIFGEREHR